MTTMIQRTAVLFCVTTIATILGPAVRADENAPAFNPAQYFYNPTAWQPLTDGWKVTGKGAGVAVLEAAPISRRVTVEADVTVRQATDDQWKTVSMAVFADNDNYWHFGLVQPPNDSTTANFCELSQMRDGQWNSHHGLKLEAHEKHAGPWKIGETYHLQITLDTQGIEGSLYDTQGKLLERIRRGFSSPAVTTGRPALRCNGFDAELRNVRVSYSNPVPEKAKARAEFPPYDSDSFVPQIKGKKTGFFHVERHGGKWWTIDPVGRGFVSLGVDHVRYTGHWCEKLGYAPYHRKMQEKYPNREDWINETAQRLKDWGFNRLSAQAWTPLVHRGLCHSRFVGIGSPMAALGDEYDITPNEGRPCSSFPNVFHPAFEAYCRYQAERTCRDSVGDPWLIGYFLDNELAWWGRGGLDNGLFDATMKKSANHTAKLALRDFLARRYDNDAAKFNTAWGTDLKSFDDILSREQLNSNNAETLTTVEADKKAFLALIAERYFAVTTGAIRAIDPDHMILGCRFAGGHASDVVWSAAAKYCEVLTLNYYGNVDLDRGIALDHEANCQGDPLDVPFARFAELAQGRPLMVTEWSFIALDSGLPCVHGAGQRFRTQTERAKAARIYAETLLRIPQLIGFDYFMWCDEPELGITSAFPEDSNYGLVNGENEPYEEMVVALSSVTHRAGELRLEGPRPLPATARPKTVSVPTAEQFVDKRTTGSPSTQSTTLRFTRQDDRFTIGNGRLTLQGKVGQGRMIDEIRLGDTVLGSYNAMVHQWSGTHQWPAVNRLIGVKAKPAAGRLTVDLVGRFETSNSDGARRPYEIAQRLWLVPETEWFVVELLSCRNLSEKPMEMRGVYFQLFPTIGGSSEADKPVSEQWVPRLWGRLPGDAWLDETAGAFLGITAPKGMNGKAYFWLNEHGGHHPDARWELERTLAPGETLRPQTPIYWIVLTGRGSRTQWEAAQRAIAE